jgi:hypothetical protein
VGIDLASFLSDFGKCSDNMVFLVFPCYSLHGYALASNKSKSVYGCIMLINEYMRAIGFYCSIISEFHSEIQLLRGRVLVFH